MSNETKTAAASGGLPTMDTAFRTTQSYGPSNHYVMIFKFGSLDDLHKADREWLARAAASQAAPEQATPNDALLTRIDDAFQNYERFGAICEFEGQPMIYASTLTEIAELRALAAPSGAPKQDKLPVELLGVREQIEGDAGFWHSCSGCHDTEDGHPTGNYHYSETMRCALGSGCSECGGIGAVWDNNDYSELVEEESRNLAAASTVPAQQAKIDALMLEHSPDEMTPEQVAEWGKHQQPASTVQSAPVLPETFQARVQPWLMECFGPVIAADHIERNHRFLEESLELVQSCGCTADEAHQLVEYVYGRPIGVVPQEVGGVMVTLAALCLAQGINMHDAGEAELARIWTKVDAIRAKQAAKPKHSPLPAAQKGGEA